MGTPLICPSPARTRCVALLLPLLLRLVVERKERKTHTPRHETLTLRSMSLYLRSFL